MNCPQCGNADTKVIDSRIIEDGTCVRRRRECEYCQSRFTTFEKKGFTELIVVKRDGRKELYDKSKIKKALLLSFAKRDISHDKIESMINQLESSRTQQSGEITVQAIGDDILALLKNVDPIAYVRFASVYGSFDDLEQFATLLTCPTQHTPED
jgi:transcriptional repressor NrdR